MEKYMNPDKAPPRIAAQIADELHAVLTRLGADPVLLSIVGSYGDTLDDAEVLRLLKDYNDDAEVMRVLKKRI